MKMFVLPRHYAPYLHAWNVSQSILAENDTYGVPSLAVDRFFAVVVACENKPTTIPIPELGGSLEWQQLFERT